MYYNELYAIILHFCPCDPMLTPYIKRNSRSQNILNCIHPYCQAESLMNERGSWLNDGHWCAPHKDWKLNDSYLDHFEIIIFNIYCMFVNNTVQKEH